MAKTNAKKRIQIAAKKTVILPSQANVDPKFNVVPQVNVASLNVAIASLGQVPVASLVNVNGVPQEQVSQEQVPQEQGNVDVNVPTVDMNDRAIVLIDPKTSMEDARNIIKELVMNNVPTNDCEQAFHKYVEAFSGSMSYNKICLLALLSSLEMNNEVEAIENVEDFLFNNSSRDYYTKHCNMSNNAMGKGMKQRFILLRDAYVAGTKGNEDKVTTFKHIEYRTFAGHNQDCFSLAYDWLLHGEIRCSFREFVERMMQLGVKKQLHDIKNLWKYKTICENAPPAAWRTVNAWLRCGYGQNAHKDYNAKFGFMDRPIPFLEEIRGGNEEIEMQEEAEPMEHEPVEPVESEPMEPDAPGGESKVDEAIDAIGSVESFDTDYSYSDMEDEDLDVDDEDDEEITVTVEDLGGSELNDIIQNEYLTCVMENKPLPWLAIDESMDEAGNEPNAGNDPNEEEAGNEPNAGNDPNEPSDEPMPDEAVSSTIPIVLKQVNNGKKVTVDLTGAEDDYKILIQEQEAAAKAEAEELDEEESDIEDCFAETNEDPERSELALRYLLGNICQHNATGVLKDDPRVLQLLNNQMLDDDSENEEEKVMPPVDELDLLPMKIYPRVDESELTKTLTKDEEVEWVELDKEKPSIALTRKQVKERSEKFWAAAREMEKCIKVKQEQIEDK